MASDWQFDRMYGWQKYMEKKISNIRRPDNRRYIRKMTVQFMVVQHSGDCFIFLYVRPPFVATPFRYYALVPHCLLGHLAL